MHPRSVLQFYPLSHPRAALRALARTEEAVEVVLDLEDSVSCVVDSARNARLKNLARAHMKMAWPRLAIGRGFSIRINELGTIEHEADMKLLRNVTELPLEHVLIPKARLGQDLTEAVRMLSDLENQAPRISLIVETVEGIDELESLVELLAKIKGRFVMGYFDYALSLGQWPMLDPLDDGYWRTIERVRRCCDRNSVPYVHAPLPILGNSPVYSEVGRRLGEISSMDYSVCALNDRQRKNWMSFSNEESHDSDNQQQAYLDPEALVSSFEFALKNRRSFAVYHQRFVSPHEYLLAKRQCEGDGNQNL